jgi:hypothetical protein
MPISTPDLQLYWQKFLIGLLQLITSRKFWLKVAADLVAYQQLRQGAITPEEFLAVFLGGTATLILAIAHEDAAAKKAVGH